MIVHVKQYSVREGHPSTKILVENIQLNPSTKIFSQLNQGRSSTKIFVKNTCFFFLYLPQALQKEGRLGSTQKWFNIFEKSIYVLFIHQALENQSSLGNAPNIKWKAKHEKYVFL